MSKHGHIDSDVLAALELRKELVDGALEQAREHKVDPGYHRAFEQMRKNRIYVWEPEAMAAFWKFWENPRNYRRFMNRYFAHDALVYRRDLASEDLHVFPTPGRLFSEELAPAEYQDSIASIIFPPTTRAIAIGRCEVAGVERLPSVILSVQADPNALKADHGVLRLNPLSVLPKRGTPEAKGLVVHLVTRFPKIVDGSVVDREPINWLMCIYQLQIFLVQPFLGHLRKIHRSESKSAGLPQPQQEIVQVSMRKPLPVQIPHYVVARFHPVTGHPLEFEVDVRGHIRHCASGKLANVRPHKRGPIGKTREKVIKVTR